MNTTEYNRGREAIREMYREYKAMPSFINDHDRNSDKTDLYLRMEQAMRVHDMKFR